MHGKISRILVPLGCVQSLRLFTPAQAAGVGTVRKHARSGDPTRTPAPWRGLPSRQGAEGGRQNAECRMKDRRRTATRMICALQPFARLAGSEACDWSLDIPGKQSQRDFVSKPRVARHELPWVRRVKKASTPTGLRQRRISQTQPRWGWTRRGGGVPGAGAARQPWALVRNLVGIHGWMLARAAAIAPTLS